MVTNLRDVMAALLAPFDQQQALGKANLRRLVQFNIQQGIDGLYMGGSMGETFVQSLSGRERVLEIVTEEAKGRVKLIAHVGCVSTTESQRLAASAKHYGFGTVSTVTPFCYSFSFEEHCGRYRAIIGSADGLPMAVYNIPTLNRIKLTLNRINILATLLSVGALKQTSGDLYQMEQIRCEHPNLVLYNGYDGIFASGLLAGVGGGTGSIYNITDWRYQRIVKALEKGDIQIAQKLQTECNKVTDPLIKAGTFRGLKTVLYYMDVVSVSLYCKPFGPVDEKYLPGLEALAQQPMQEYG